MSVHTSAASQRALREKLGEHKRQTERLHAELLEYAATLDDAPRAKRLSRAVEEHKTADDAFAGDALACVPPVP